MNIHEQMEGGDYVHKFTYDGCQARLEALQAKMNKVQKKLTDMTVHDCNDFCHDCHLVLLKALQILEGE